jgi:hypothetical protein
MRHFSFEDFLDKKHIVSLVGAGGKTTVMYQLVEHFAKKLTKLKDDVLAGKVKINTVYNGLEFDPVTKKFVDQDAKNHRNKK